jgi:hypothetical protein
MLTPISGLFMPGMALLVKFYGVNRNKKTRLLVIRLQKNCSELAVFTLE